MAYSAVPGTKFEWIDQSQSPIVTTSTQSYPVYLFAFASDKGREDIFVADSNTFPKQYLTNSVVSFAKYGQPLLTAAQVAAAGGKVICKRVVAKNSSLANKLISAKVTVTNVQKTDSTGHLLYTDATTGIETTIATDNTPLMIDKCGITYIAESFMNCESIDDIEVLADAKFDEDDTAKIYTYPLFIVADNGRGVSKKKFRISPDYKKSKRLDYMKYTLEVIEDSNYDSPLETLSFTGNPDIIESNVNRSLSNIVSIFSDQITCKLLESYYLQFVSKVETVSKNTDLLNSDFLFAKTRKQIALDNITIDYTSEDATNLSYSFGLTLDNGSNGDFGDNPLTTGKTAYETALLEFYNGTFSSDIYDLNNYKIDLICDANYPSAVKRAIEALVTFREDCEYIRDLGLGLTTLDDIAAANDEVLKNRYCTTYHLSYEISDPYTKKPIKVTMVYELAILLVDHFLEGRNRPVAGQLYDLVLTKCIKGTESFIPKVTPTEDQADKLCEMAVNYASYYDGILVLETELTSQDDLSQLSYLNNVFLMQEIVKALRERCPKTRYSFIEGADLTIYTQDVQTVLDKYSSSFKQLKLVYLEDTTMKENKIYYAAILGVFKDFAQQEYFKLYALNEITQS